MITTLTVNEKIMQEAVRQGFTNATALADYLVCQSLPFRDAYALVGKVVNHCLSESNTLETLPLSIYQKFSSKFEAGLYNAIRYHVSSQIPSL